MRIARLQIENFRNFPKLDLKLSPATVIVGENRSGKSNLIHAMRLVLDPSLSQNDRQLGREDFWDGLSDGTDDWDPMQAGHVIEISVELVDFEEELAVVAALGDALTTDNPLRARITYRYAPISANLDRTSVTPKYRSTIYGGGDLENQVPNDLRGYLHFVFLHALRNVEDDIRNWRRSPLRRMLEAVAKDASEEELQIAREAVSAANESLRQIRGIKKLGETISDRTEEMVGEHQALDASLALAAQDPTRLIRAMRIFIDGQAERPLSAASLGTLNVLYFALLELGLESRLDAADIAHAVVAIEEPEAHLHPHLQRLIFRRILDGRGGQQSVFVSTQSPHIASVADPKSLIMLHSDGTRSIAACARDADLNERAWDDISRYLDVTRAEMVFARKALLVEGYAEAVLASCIAEASELDLDQEGITVCAINGTHFSTYVEFCDALQIPWAIATDGDASANGTLQGERRASRLLEYLGSQKSAEEEGIFVGDHTFEYDLAATSEKNFQYCVEVLAQLAGPTLRRTVSQWSELPLYENFMRAIEKVGGKGRFAQRLASYPLSAPSYYMDALRYLKDHE